MKRILVFSSIVFIYFNSLSFAQGTKFKVLALKGKILIGFDNSNHWIPLTLGTEITTKEKIKVDKNSYLGLAFFPEGIMEIKNSGEYDFEGLTDIFRKNYHTVDKKFSSYIFSELEKKISRIKEMRQMGATIRLRPNYIVSALPASFCTIDSIIEFKWYPVSGSSDYIFKLMNSSNRTVFMKEINDTSITVNLAPLFLEDDSTYKWYIYDNTDPSVSSDTNNFTKFSKLKAEAINDSLKELKNTLGDEYSALNQIIYSEFFQRNQLNIEALKALEKAVELEPSVEAYNRMLDEFLNNMRIIKMSE